MRKLRKGAAALLCVLMLVTLLPITAMAAVGIESGVPPATMFTKNVTTIGFAGHEWYVIDTGTDGVTNPGSGSLTLLAKSSFGTSAFRIGQNNQPADTTGWSQYSGDNWWYQGSFTQPSDYNDSTLMRALATATDALPQNEAAQIAERYFTTADGIGGDAVANQMLWPLSEAEYSNMGTLTGDAFSGIFWLRLPFIDFNAYVGVPGGGPGFDYRVYVPGGAVRPALHLNLASVLFTSDASDTSGKSTATVGSGLIGAQAPSQNLKFTFSDGTSAPTVTFAGTTDGTSTLRFGYSGANTGTNRYLSCVLTQGSGASEEVKYYGKLANCATTASGVFSIDTSTLAGAYTLKVYSEQANGNTYSDFASTTTDFTLDVSGGNGTITGGTHDTTKPTVSSVTPDNAATNIAVSGNIEITFSEAMNPAAGVGEVKLNSGTALTGGSWTNATTYTVPYSGLTASTAYTVSISGFQDAAGNAMDANNTNGFTTAAQGVTLYTLTVANGTGGGSYAAGAQVSITADAAPAGQVFDKWTGGNGGTFANANSASTTFTMPAGNATVTATYKADGGNNGSDPGPAPNPPNPGPTYEYRTLRHTATGITLTGYFTSDAELVVTENALHATGTCAACDEIRAQGGWVCLYDVSITGSHSGNMDLSLPVDSGYNGQSMSVWHCKRNHVEKLSGTAQNGAVVVTVSSLSPFAVFATDNHNPDTGIPVPQTGDNSNMGGWLALLTASLLLAGFAAWQLVKRRTAARR